MKDLLVFTIIAVLLCTHKSIKPVVAQKERELCVEPTHQNGTGTEITSCSNYITWTFILSNPSRYLTSYTKLYFVPGMYRLDRHLQINNVKNFSIIGDHGGFTILCPTNTNNASLSISNSLFVELKNVKLKYCKMSIQHIQFIASNSPLSTNISAAVFLYNVTSLTIENIGIVNSYCHGIIGVNALGTLRNVSIFYTYKKDVRKHGIVIGGFVFVDDVQNHNYKEMQEILIDGCVISNMSNTASSNGSGDLHTSVIGIAFHQQSYFVKVKLFNITIKDVSVNQGGPIVMIHYNDSIINSVHIVNSSFYKITNKQQPIISVLTMPSEASIIGSSVEFALIHFKIISSTARYIFHVLQPVTNPHMKINITVYQTRFESNKAE